MHETTVKCQLLRKQYVLHRRRFIRYKLLVSESIPLSDLSYVKGARGVVIRSFKLNNKHTSKINVIKIKRIN